MSEAIENLPEWLSMRTQRPGEPYRGYGLRPGEQQDGVADPMVTRCLGCCGLRPAEVTARCPHCQRGAGSMTVIAGSVQDSRAADRFARWKNDRMIAESFTYNDDELGFVPDGEGPDGTAEPAGKWTGARRLEID
jgi:hypothetical protein